MTSSSGPFHRGNLKTVALLPVSLQSWNLPTCITSFGSHCCCWHDFMTSHCWVTLGMSPYILHHVLAVFSSASGALSLTVCSSFLPPSRFWEALSVTLVSALLPSLFIHGLAGLVSSDVHLLLSGFLLSQLLGMLVWPPWPGTGSTCLLSSPTLMRTPLLSCWQCIPAKAQQAEATDCPVMRGSCLFLPAPLFRETTRKKKASLCDSSSLLFPI